MMMVLATTNFPRCQSLPKSLSLTTTGFDESISDPETPSLCNEGMKIYAAIHFEAIQMLLCGWALAADHGTVLRSRKWFGVRQRRRKVLDCFVGAFFKAQCRPSCPEPSLAHQRKGPFRMPVLCLWPDLVVGGLQPLQDPA